jgi:AraC-like DNA-binding protein
MDYIYESNLLYSPEHLACSNYLKNVKYGFRYREYPEGCEVARDASYANVLMFIISGKVEANILLYSPKIINSGEMFLIPVNSFFNFKCLEPTVAIAFVFEHWAFNCTKMPFDALKKYNENKVSDIYVEKINAQLMQFLELIKLYLRNGVNCSYLHKLKADELFLVLRSFYSNEKLSSLFYLMLDGAMDFRLFCIQNVNQVKSINELVALSHMSRTTFYNTFRAEFGDVSPKKWLNTYIHQRILHIAATPGISAKSLMYKVGFEDESSFAQYCRRHFDRTPSEIIKECGGIRTDI